MTFIFLHLSLYIYVCTFIFIHLLLYIYIFTFTFVHLYLHIHIFTIKSITLHLYIDNCVFILASFIHSPVDIYICTFTFVYLYVCIDICTFTFIHLHCVIKNRRRFWRVQGRGAHKSAKSGLTRTQAFGFMLGHSLAFISPIEGSTLALKQKISK